MVPWGFVAYQLVYKCGKSNLSGSSFTGVNLFFFFFFLFFL